MYRSTCAVRSHSLFTACDVCITVAMTFGQRFRALSVGCAAATCGVSTAPTVGQPGVQTPTVLVLPGSDRASVNLGHGRLWGSRRGERGSRRREHAPVVDRKMGQKLHCSDMRVKKVGYVIGSQGQGISFLWSLSHTK